MFMYTDYTQHLLDNVKKIHFIGCGGSGMYPLIQILSAKGYDISGSDVLDGSIIRSEREMGVKVTLGHSADNVVGADLVVYSAAIAKDNVELNAAASYGITTVERSVLLGYVSRLYKQSICVSGTHGKTTTTSMITTALELAGRDPSAVIGGKLPLITSCSPGWIRYCEQHYPEMLDNVSSCKSPQQMFGSLVKSYYAEKTGIDPKDIFVVSIMPCTAKKYEVQREEQRMTNGCMPVDVSLTTRELARMIQRAGILFDHLPEGQFDQMLGVSTGAAVIFGATGGVMEAALRTVVEIVTGGEMKPLEFHEVRGMAGIKEAIYDLPGKTVKVCVASGLHNAKQVLDGLKSGELDYDFVEFMACPGGCINGGGQPLQPADVRSFTDIKGLRAAALYQQDETMIFRKSHENPFVQTIYKDYLGEPGSHKAHELLHCTYVPQKRYRV